MWRSSERKHFMKKPDRRLGMHRDITRRDFIHDVSLASLGLSLPAAARASFSDNQTTYYPPTLTGLRGSHPGSFEVAHALARGHKVFNEPKELDESYDLIVVGGGLSGLSAAYFYRKRHGPDANILILENHDDFGGHAKRNEFHQGGPERLAWGGTVNLEYTKYSATAKGLLDELGIDIPRLLENFEYGWLDSPTGLQAAIWFDKQT
jgi:spermidine dehydrogenase